MIWLKHKLDNLYISALAYMPKICSIDQEYGHPILSKETADMCLYTMHIHLGKD